jgi:hypothetical protein
MVRERSANLSGRLNNVVYLPPQILRRKGCTAHSLVDYDQRTSTQRSGHALHTARPYDEHLRAWRDDRVIQASSLTPTSSITHVRNASLLVDLVLRAQPVQPALHLRVAAPQPL